MNEKNAVYVLVPYFSITNWSHCVWYCSYRFSFDDQVKREICNMRASEQPFKYSFSFCLNDWTNFPRLGKCRSIYQDFYFPSLANVSLKAIQYIQWNNQCNDFFYATHLMLIFWVLEYLWGSGKYTHPIQRTCKKKKRGTRMHQTECMC